MRGLILMCYACKCGAFHLRLFFHLSRRWYGGLGSLSSLGGVVAVTFYRSWVQFSLAVRLVTADLCGKGGVGR